MYQCSVFRSVVKGDVRDYLAAFLAPLTVYVGCDYDSSVYGVITFLLPFLHVLSPIFLFTQFGFTIVYIVSFQPFLSWPFLNCSLPHSSPVWSHVTFPKLLSLQKLWVGRSRKPSQCFQTVTPAPQSGFLWFRFQSYQDCKTSASHWHRYNLLAIPAHSQFPSMLTSSISPLLPGQSLFLPEF